MDHRKREKHMFISVLAKFLGLNHILNPTAFKLFGYDVYHIFFVFLVVYMGLMSIIAGYNGLYYWVNHKFEALMHMAMVDVGLHTCYKMSIIFRRWRQIRDCLTITRYDFTSYSRSRCGSFLDLWRSRIFLITSMYAFLCLSGITLYVLSPWMFSHGVNTMKSLDGSQSNYRINVLNMYAFFSAETYNTHFNMLYMAESAYLILCVFFLVMFDTLIFTLCLAFSCQLQVINVAFESCGPKRIIKHLDQTKIDDEIGSTIFYSPLEHYLAYNELKAVIIDYQSIIKKLENFFCIFQVVMLSQICICAFEIVVVLVNLAIELADGEIDEGSNITIIKMILSCPISLIELFMTCYIFESLHKQKETIVFALYCSNWTEMDMKCRNLILLTTRMNNAHIRKLKFSQTKIVNLEMFFMTMRVCYSVVSVILKKKFK